LFGPQIERETGLKEGAGFLVILALSIPCPILIKKEPDPARLFFT
jgi:hypothetical protein